jgi:hypothetical protein
MDHKINEIYSHVATRVEQNLLDALQARWQRSLPQSPLKNSGHRDNDESGPDHAPS